MEEENEENPSLEQQFLDAVGSGNKRKAAAIMKRGKLSADVVDRRRPDQPTALLIASERGDVEMAELLLKAKPKPADVNASNSKGKRSIWFACDVGDRRLAEVLIACGCEVNYVDQQTGCTPLYWAVLKNSTEVCRLLALAGADVNLRRLGYGTGAKTPLIEAVLKDNIEVCSILVNSRCDINSTADGGYSALHYAIAYKRYAIAELLLDNCIDVHGAARHGVTAMALAIEHGDPLACRTLAAYGCDLDRPFAWGETPLELAIQMHSEKCALALVAWGCRLTVGGTATTPPSVAVASSPPTYFYRAAAEGLTTLLELMAAVCPRLLNEPWVRQRQPPLALYRKPEVLGRLYSSAETARPLVALCRASVHAHLRGRQPERVLLLPVPTSYASYLTFGDIVSQDIYRPMRLTTLCPYDCDSQHASSDRSCADVEISDADSDGGSGDSPCRSADGPDERAVTAMRLSWALAGGYETQNVKGGRKTRLRGRARRDGPKAGELPLDRSVAQP